MGDTLNRLDRLPPSLNKDRDNTAARILLEDSPSIPVAPKIGGSSTDTKPATGRDTAQPKGSDSKPAKDGEKPSETKPTGSPDKPVGIEKKFGDVNIIVQPDYTAYAQDKDGKWVKGTIKGIGGFVAVGEKNEGTWVVSPNGSQVRAKEYNYSGELTKEGKPPLVRYSEISADGEEIALTRDNTNKDRYAGRDSNGQLVERYCPDIASNSTYTWEEGRAGGVTTIVFGDGDKRQWGSKELETPYIDSEGRLIGTDAPLLGEEGSVASILGGINRKFGYANSKSTMLVLATAVPTKGEYAGQEVTRYRPLKAGATGNSEQDYENYWMLAKVTPPTNVSVPVNVFVGRGLFGRPHFQQQMQIRTVAGTTTYERDDRQRGLMAGKQYYWHEKIGPENHQFNASHINRADGSVVWADKVATAKDSNGKVVGRTVRYFDANVNHIGSQNINRWGEKGELVMRGTPGATFDLAGNLSYMKGGEKHFESPDGTHRIDHGGGRETITYGDGTGKQFLKIPNNREEITNADKSKSVKYLDGTRRFGELDEFDRTITSGLQDKAGNVDNNFCLKFTYANQNGKPVLDANNKPVVETASRVINGHETQFWTKADGEAEVTEKGELKHWAKKMGPDGKTMVEDYTRVVFETPELATITRAMTEDGQIGRILEKTIAGPAKAKRVFSPDGDPDQPDLITDTFQDRMGNIARIEYKAVAPGDPAGPDKKPEPVRVYEVTREIKNKDGKILQSTAPELYTALYVLKDGTMEATNYWTGKRNILLVPENQKQVLGIKMAESQHLARARDNFYAAMGAQTGSDSGADRRMAIFEASASTNTNDAEESYNGTVLGNGYDKYSRPLDIVPPSSWASLGEERQKKLAAEYDLAAEKLRGQGNGINLRDVAQAIAQSSQQPGTSTSKTTKQPRTTLRGSPFLRFILGLVSPAET